MNAASHAFISYQRTDEAFARAVRERLVSAGVPVWMDQFDIAPGAYWPDAIDAALAASATVVGILSPDAVASRNVKNEWDWALQNGKPLILLQVAPCLVPHRYVSLHFIDATGDDPAPALAALSRALGVPDAEEPSAPPPTRHVPRVPRPASRVPTHIAGREREQDTLRAQLDRLFAGHGSLLLIGGEAGIGKTTLTSWLAAEAETRGAVALTGGCYDLTTTPPYGPWAEIIRAWPTGGRFPPVPDELRGGEAMARLQSQAALFELAADLFATASMTRPLVVTLEDLHWADQASLDLLRYLSRVAHGFRALFVMTYRDDEVTRQHPLYQLLPALAREPGTERLTLGRLGADAIGEIVSARYDLDDATRARLVAHVSRLTEGNPFFTGEVLRALEESRALTKTDDGWRVGPLDHIAVPELARQVIGGRLARLADDVQRLLGIAAVIGHEVPLDVWIAVSGADEDLLSDALERATEAHIIEELPRGDGFRFTHALIRETLYEGLGLLRRRAVHRAAGETLAAGARPDPDIVAHHFSRASDPRAYDWLVEAGKRAQRSYAWLIASERFEQAAALIADDPSRRRDYAWLHFVIAWLVRYTDTPRALALVEEGARIGRDIGDWWLYLFGAMQGGYYRLLTGNFRDGVARMVAMGEAMDAAFRDGRLDSWTSPGVLVEESGMVAANLSVARKHPEPPTALSQSLPALHLAGTGRLREALALAERLLSVWQPEIESMRVAGMSMGLGYAMGDLHHAIHRARHALGQPDEALASADAALGIYRSIPHYVLIVIMCEAKADTLIVYRTENVRDRRAAVEEALEAARSASGAFEDSTAVGADLEILEGDWQTTRERLTRHRSTAIAGRRIQSATIASSQLGRLLAAQGDRDEAWQIIDATLPDGPETEPGDCHLGPVIAIIQSAASLALDARDYPNARAWLECHDHWLEWSGTVLGQVDGHLGWARYHRETGDLDAAEAQARTALAKASDPRQPLGLIAANRLLGELATQPGNHAAARQHLEDALDLAERCEASFEVALTQIALAELHLATGERAVARDLLAAARETCERLGARPALERIDAL